MKKIWLKFLSVLCVGAVFVAPVWGADNGCDNPANDMITPELALCSTHVYNIGALTNPSETERGLMQDVIAMKTTLIAQQMYRQYEQMESMLSRLKTQMEKAVFTSNLQVASGGGNSSDSGGGTSYKSNDKNIYLAGVRNCLNVYQDADILKCYEENLNAVINSSRNGNDVSTDLKRQLAHDFENLAGITFSGNSACKDLVDVKCYNKTADGTTQMMSKKDFNTCLNKMRTCLQNQYRAYNESQRMLKKVD